MDQPFLFPFHRTHGYLATYQFQGDGSWLVGMGDDNIAWFLTQLSNAEPISATGRTVSTRTTYLPRHSFLITSGEVAWESSTLLPCQVYHFTTDDSIARPCSASSCYIARMFANAGRFPPSFIDLSLPFWVFANVESSYQSWGIPILSRRQSNRTDEA